jgi:hypothetical protein
MVFGYNNKKIIVMTIIIIIINIANIFFQTSILFNNNFKDLGNKIDVN